MEITKIFKNEEFGEISVISKDKKEYFEATSVATILGYQNPRDAILRHCKKDGVVFHNVRVVTGIRKDGSKAEKHTSKKYISEGNLYRLIMKSKMPNAVQFESWIMDEVLPDIRKHGVYMDNDVIEKTLQSPDFIIKLATELKKERQEKIMAQRKLENLEAVITIDKPYTNFGKKIAVTSDAITIGQFAKLLANNNIVMGRNRLFDFLREQGYLIKKGKDKNIPKQPYLEQGLFKIAERVVNTVEGEILSTTTLITGKGQMYFLDLLSGII